MHSSSRRPLGQCWPVWLRSASSATVWLLLCVTASAGTIIQTENAKPGTTAWQITNLATNREIEGYASLTSVPRGGQISFFVNTIDTTFQIEIFRMGWYGGLGGRRMTQPVQLTGTKQVIPVPDPTTGLVECNWINPYVLTIPNNTSDPSDWASGVYLAKLTGLTSGKQRNIVFVVRDDVRPSSYFFQTSVNTYQAYNNWGGKSLYSYNSTNGQAQKVSFNRPYAGHGGEEGSGDFLHDWEYNMVRFLEREGYDLAYCTDVDTHENANLILAHKAFLVVGHDEYWSWQMRSNVTAARDRGVSLASFSANTMYWQIRYEPSGVNAAPDRTIVAYKELATTRDPLFLDGISSNDNLVTVQWRQPPVNLPEVAIFGVMYGDGPVQGNLVVVNAAHPAFASTGLQNGSVIPGLLGYEVDHTSGSAPANTQTLMHSPYTINGVNSFSDMTIYTATSGAIVFAAGTMEWSWGLDDYNAPTLRPSWLNPAAQQVTRNLLAIFIGDQPPVAKPGGPYAGGPSQPVQFNGGSSFDPDGTVTAYEWNFGDGSTATGITPTHVYSATGTYTVQLIVTDDKGSRNAASTTATITDFSLGVSSNSISAIQGTSASDSVNVSPLGGFSGTVSFGVSGLPSGAGASFSPTTVKTSGSTSMSVTTSSSTPSGTYPLTIVGTNGNLQHAVQVSLTVNPAASGDYSLSAAASRVFLLQGTAGTDSISVAPSNGFNSTVTFSISGVPAASSASFSAGSVAGSGSTVLNLNAGAFQHPICYALTITGTSGILQHSVGVSLCVSRPGPSPDFAVGTWPPLPTVSPGSSASTVAYVTATDLFSGTVSLTVSGLPAGANANFSANSVVGGGAPILTITTSTTTTKGTYTLTVTGTSGSLSRSTQLTLTLGP